MKTIRSLDGSCGTEQSLWRVRHHKMGRHTRYLWLAVLIGLSGPIYAATGRSLSIDVPITITVANPNCSSTGATITICGASSGVSTRYMGTQEDTSTFHLAWLQDIGFNSYRFTNLTWMEPV